MNQTIDKETPSIFLQNCSVYLTELTNGLKTLKKIEKFYGVDVTQKLIGDVLDLLSEDDVISVETYSKLVTSFRSTKKPETSILILS